MTELRDATVGIVGLGLMGGSLGRALEGRCAHRIGADVDPARAARAVELGVIDEAATDALCAERADLLVLAMPVRAIVAASPRLVALLRPGAAMTDIGSTKAAICNAFDALPTDIAAIGGHPMCGREQGGIDAADADLFRGATWVLCPSSRTTADASALVTELVHAVGATPVELDRDAHDRAVATASHLPYVVAQSLVRTLVDAGEPATTLASTGFASTTRMAGGDVEMWLDILTTNPANVRDAISHLRANLDRLDAALDDPQALEPLLATPLAALGRPAP